MDTINFACSTTDIKTVGSYTYYLQSRIDNYIVILRENLAETEYLFYVIRSDEDVNTVWANPDAKTYKRPDAMAISVKKYVVNKLREFKKATTSVANNWS
ncbi:MAG: hypothetical protein ACTSWG_10515 [Candidatus Helarchaeota archaeon]